MIIINKNIKYLLFIILLIASVNVKAFAEAEYDSLPMLDGKYDSKIEASTTNKPVLPRLDSKKLSHNSPPTSPKVVTSNAPESKNTIGTSDSPQLDLLTPQIKAQHRQSSLSFRRYKKDLKHMLGILIELKTAIDQGLPVQEYSAIASNAKFENDIFIRKYKSKPECHYETYKLVQDAVNSAIYTRDYWLKTNKITYNMNGVPEKVIQTKFLKIATSVDKLVEMIEMETALSQE